MKVCRLIGSSLTQVVIKNQLANLHTAKRACLNFVKRFIDLRLCITRVNLMMNGGSHGDIQFPARKVTVIQRTPASTRHDSELHQSYIKSENAATLPSLILVNRTKEHIHSIRFIFGETPA